MQFSFWGLILRVLNSHGYWGVISDNERVVYLFETAYHGREHYGMLSNDSVSFLHPGDIAEPHLTPLALEKGEPTEDGEVVHLPCTALHALFPLLMYSITQYGLIPKSTPTPSGTPLLFERQTYGWSCFWNLLSVTSGRSSYS